MLLPTHTICYVIVQHVAYVTGRTACTVRCDVLQRLQVVQCSRSVVVAVDEDQVTLVGSVRVVAHSAALPTSMAQRAHPIRVQLCPAVDLRAYSKKNDCIL